nr:Rootletin [Hymenolepis microstoma]
MSSNGTNSSTPRHTPSSGSEEETVTHEEQDRNVITTHPSVRPQQPEPLSLLAESQRLQREMLRVEMGEMAGAELSSVGGGATTARSEISPAAEPTSLALMASPTRTRIQLIEAELLDSKRRAASFHESNQRHQKLIQTLQSQLTQSKRKNTDLEMEIEDLKLKLQKNAKKLQSKELEQESRLDARESVAKMREESLIAELENLTGALEAERAKSAELSRSNEILQDQIEEAASANQGLSRDVAQLTQAWRGATQALEKLETEWQSEENAFNEYFSAEHNRLLALWREVVALRRAFAELRHQTARDFTQMNSEITRMGQFLVSSCCALANNLRAAELESAEALAKSRRELQAEEENAKARNQSLSEALARSQARLIEAESSAHELNRRVQDLLSEISDKDRVLNTLRRLRAAFPTSKQEETEKIRKEQSDEETEDPIAVTKCLIEQTHAMHQALSQIAQTVLSDTANADMDEAQEPFLASFQHQMQTKGWISGDEDFQVTSRTRRPRSTSPVHRASPQATSTIVVSTLPRSISTPATAITPPTKLAETTLVAVQSALNRRAMQVQALLLKFSSLRGRLDGLSKRYSEGEEERSHLMEQTNSLRSDLDAVRKGLDATRLERDKAKHSLTVALEERSLVERARNTASEQVAELQREIEQFRRLLYDTSKERDALFEQCNSCQLQFESETRENERLQRLLEQSEARGAQHRNDAEVARSEAEKKEQQLASTLTEMVDITAKCNRSEQLGVELGDQISKLQQERQKLQERLTNLEEVLSSRDQERSQLAHQVSLLADNERRLSEERNALRTECQQLRNEVLRIDAEAQLSSSELVRLRNTIDRLENQRAQAEAEALRYNRERVELTEEVATTNQRAYASEEEIDTLRREISQHVSSMRRLNEEREELMRDKDDLTARLSLAERERHQLSDLVSKLRNDREVLDNEAFLAQRQITELKNKVEKQETDIANLNLRRNTLQAEVQRVRSDFEAELGKIQRQRDRLGAKYTAEVEELRANLAAAERRLAEAEEAAVQAVLRADRVAAEATKASMRETDRLGVSERESQRWAEEQARLNHELILAQRERDNALLRAEQERQKVLALAAEDHATVRERIVLLQETITDLEKTLERTRREAKARCEKDEAVLKTAKEDLYNCLEKMEEFKKNHEKEVRDLRAQVKSLEATLEQTVHECNEAKLQLRLCEESQFSHRSEFSRTTKLLREAEESRNSLRGEVDDQRRQITELEGAKNALEGIVQELRRKLRDAEVQRTDQIRSLDEMRERLKASECRRCFHRGNGEQDSSGQSPPPPSIPISGSHNDILISELRQKLAEYEIANSRLQQDFAELRINQLEEVKQECTALRKELAESETARRRLEDELSSFQSCIGDAGDRSRSRRWSTSLSVEEVQRDCRRLKELERILQSRLESAEQANSQLNTELKSATRRLTVAEFETRMANEARCEAESRLSAIHSLLRRLLGYHQRHGASPNLMLLSKRRGRPFPLDEIETGFCDEPTGPRAGSTSNEKILEKSDSKSPSAKRRDSHLPQDWSEMEFGEGQKATLTSSVDLHSSRSGLHCTRGERSLSLTSDLDPEAVGYTIREMLNQLAQMENERDDALMSKRVCEEQLLTTTSQLNEHSDEVQKLRKVINSLEEEQKTLSDQLRSSRSDLLNQESELRRVSKERDEATVRIKELQESLQLLQEDSRGIQERLNASKAMEARAAEEQRKELRSSLKDAEDRLAVSESARRSLKADLSHQKAINSDKTEEIKALKVRLGSLTSTLSELERRAEETTSAIERLSAQNEEASRREAEARSRAQTCADRCADLEVQNGKLQERIIAIQRLLDNADHNQHLLQERLDNAQKCLNVSKAQLEQLNSRFQKLQSQLTDTDLARCELENQNRQLTRQLGELESLQKDLTHQVINLKLEKEKIQTKLDDLQKGKSDLEKSQKEYECNNKELREKLKELHLEFEHMVRERLREKELNNLLVSSQEDIRKRTNKLEEENLDYRRQIQRLNAQLALREESHASRLDELLRQRHTQIEKELERKCSALQQCEKSLQAKEQSHRQRVKSLEDQVRMLNEQLSHEATRRQLYMSTSRLPIALVSSLSHLPSTLAHSHEGLSSLSPDFSRPATEEGVFTARPPRQPQMTSAVQPRIDTVGDALSASVTTPETPLADVSVQTPST